MSTRAATYDAGDRQATETDNGLTTVYGYDAQGQQRVATVQDGQTAIATVLDAEGRVTSISEGAGNAGPYVSSFTYNSNDLLQAVTLPGGVQESVQYDPNSQLVGVTALGPNTNGTFTHLGSQYNYTYDAANRVNSTTTLSGTDALAYDGPGRLMSETQQTGHQIIATGGKYGWTYDGNGNILTAIDDTGATDVYTYSTTIRDELTQMGATDNPVTKTNAYSYDGRGDVTGIANTAAPTDKNALSQHLSYDSQGRVTQVTYLDHTNGNTTTTISIGYNADGQRSDYTYTPQGQPTLDTQFQYRNGQLAQQRVISNTTANGPVVIYTNTYLYGPQGEPLELLHAQPGQTVARYWYILDGQGSVVALTDANGSVVDRYAYDSWGESTSDDRTNEHVPQQLRYKAQYYDEKLTWYWMPDTRYYDPETERYLQPTTCGGTPDYVFRQDDSINWTEANSRSGCLILLHREQGVATGSFIGYHLYLTVTEANGTTHVFEGVHTSELPIGGPPLQATLARHPEPGGTNGIAFANIGNQRQTIGVVKRDTAHSCAGYINTFRQLAQDINDLDLAYSAGSVDSNSVVYTLLNEAFLNPPQDVNDYPHAPGVHTFVPGWGNDLFDCVQSGYCLRNGIQG